MPALPCGSCLRRGVWRWFRLKLVLDDIAAQVDAGAQHITFGDPDFFNGPAHARRIVEALHCRFPALSYDVTVKVEHLLRHTALLPYFVKPVVHSVDDTRSSRWTIRCWPGWIKGHTRQYFSPSGKIIFGGIELIRFTVITFTPWATRQSYTDLLRTIAETGRSRVWPRFN